MNTRGPGAAGRQRADPPREAIGLALAGGGFLGAAYELGVLAALSEAIDGLDLTRLHIYVGVSAGGFVAAGLANGIGPHRMVRMFVDGDEADLPFDPATLLHPAWTEIGRSLRRLPGALGSMITAALNDRHRGLRAMGWRALERAGAVLPTGIIDGNAAERTMSRLLSIDGRSDDFRVLRGRLRIVATDIDSGQAVEFGASGFDRVPISRAVSASSAVPGLFSPVAIEGRHYVDGALNKTMHASVALREGARLVLCVNPLVPFRSAGAPAEFPEAHARATLPLLLSQSIRTAIRSRMTVGLEKYRATHPDATVLLFEPGADDAQTFSTSIFSLASRRRLCEHAYQRTRADLRQRRVELDRQLERFGLRLNTRVLDDASLRLVRAAARPAARRGSLDAARRRLEQVLGDLERAVKLAGLA